MEELFAGTSLLACEYCGSGLRVERDGSTGQDRYVCATSAGATCAAVAMPVAVVDETVHGALTGRVGRELSSAQAVGFAGVLLDRVLVGVGLGAATNPQAHISLRWK